MLREVFRGAQSLTKSCSKEGFQSDCARREKALMLFAWKLDCCKSSGYDSR